jgi:hypothetical protein
MRFPKETVAAIHDSGATPITVRWPAGEEPQKGGVYYLASEEDARGVRKRAKERREYSPETHAEVMAQMHKQRYGNPPAGFKPKKHRRPTRRPTKGDARIKVLDVEILEKGWNATVALYDDPDPVRHTGLKTRVRGGDHPSNKEWGQVATELEPEEIVIPQSRREREDEEESLKVESAASADRKEVARLERRVAEQKRQGKPSKKTEQALIRARKRVASTSAAAPV